MEAGSITFSTALDNKQLEKDLSSLTKKIEKTERSILATRKDLEKAKESASNLAQKLSDARTARLPIAEQLEDAVKKAGESSLKINRLKSELEEAQTALNPDTNAGFDLPLEKFLKYQEDVKKLPQEIKNAEKEYEKLNSESVRFTKQVNEHDSKIEQLNNSLSKQNQIVSDINARLENETSDLSRQKEEAGHIVQQLDEAVRKQNGFAKASASAEKAMGRLGKRIMSLAASALVFNVISRALTSLQQLTMKYIKTNNEARAAIAQLKGALLTLAQPLIEVIIPAFTLLVNILARIITAVAQFVSMLFGKTLNQSKKGAEALHKEANAIGAVGEAAKEAAGSLAGFDEINQINTESAKNAGGVGGAGDEIMPDFGDFDPGKYKDIIDELMVYLSGALLVIGAILLFSGANIPLGLGLMVLGAAILADEIAENWGAVDGKVRNAVNRMLIILGGALLVIGAILCFSGANIPLGIGLMILGAAMLATAVALNWNSLGEEVQSALSALLQIIGAMLAVIGVILAVTGHLALGIGLIVAGIALFAAGEAAGEDGDFLENLRAKLSDALGVIGGFLAVVGLLLIVTGHFLTGLAILIAGIAVLEYEEVRDDDGMTMQEKIKTVLEKTLEAVSPIIAIVGLLLLVTGHFFIGLALLVSGIAIFEYSKVKDDGGMSVQEKITTVLENTLKIATGFLLVLGLILLLIPPMWPTAIALIAAGAVGLVTAAALNWNAIKEKLQEMWQGIKNWWDRDVKKYFTLEYWKNKGKEIIDGFLDGLKKAWDGLSSWFSGVWDNLFSNRKVSVGVTGTSSAGNYNSGSRMAARALPSIAPVSIPALARGAVIPPNREFLAVLGDQRRGTNIEAPLETIKQALAEVMQSQGGSNVYKFELYVNSRRMAVEMVKEINDMSRQAGKPVLLI